MQTGKKRSGAQVLPLKAATGKAPDIASVSVPDTLAALKVNPQAGLTGAEVETRRQEHGYNEVAEEKGRPGHRTCSILGFGPDVAERPFQGGRTV